MLSDLGDVSAACERWNMPLLAMMYPRGPKIVNSNDPELVAHGAIVAADLGADLVKVPWVGTVSAMADVVQSCPIPVVVAGGCRRDEPGSLMAYVDQVLDSGAAGLAMGRNIFQSPDPEATAHEIASRIHAPDLIPAAHQLRTLTEIDLNVPAGISKVS